MLSTCAHILQEVKGPMAEEVLTLSQRVLYSLPYVPAPLVTAAQAAVKTGRAARRWVDGTLA